MITSATVTSPYLSANASRATSSPASRIAAEGPVDAIEIGTSSSLTGAAAMTLPAGVAPSAASVERSAGQSLLVGTAVALALLGAAGGALAANPVATRPAPPSASSQVGAVSMNAQEALDTLHYLGDVGVKGGGGLYHTRLGLFEESISPEKAFDDLVGGHEVRFRDASEVTPHLVNSFEQLKSLKAQVQEQQLRNAINHGIDQVQQGADAVGNVFRGN